MGISSHLGIVLLMVIGVVTILAVIIIAAFETIRMDREKTSVSLQPATTPADKKRG